MSDAVDDTSVTVGVHLTVAAVAQRLGVAPATLRTWDRRYGLGPSEHSAGSHRRYSPTDVVRLETMQRLLQRGAGPAEAARLALAGFEDSSDVLDVPLRSTAATGVVTANSVRGLARAAQSLDSADCARIIQESITRCGTISTWNNLVAPVLVEVGRMWDANGGGIDVEHILSESVLSVLVGRIASLERPVNDRPVLMACAPEEQHTLPLFALAAALAERRVGCRMLGARVPSDSLTSAVQRTGPGAVVLWSQSAHTAAQVEFDGLTDVRRPALVFLGGPGWEGDARPGTRVLGGLDEAVEAISVSVAC
ncbi:MAG: MerR family transcriptional regulator [Actinobacteria bacterium]|nr:MerR family transcriptional regulator [Actinomycetota bacterium]